MKKLFGFLIAGAFVSALTAPAGAFTNRRALDLQFENLGDGISVSVEWEVVADEDVTMDTKIVFFVDGVAADSMTVTEETHYLCTVEDDCCTNVCCCDACGYVCDESQDPCVCVKKPPAAVAVLALGGGELVSAELYPAPGAAPDDVLDDDVVSKVFTVAIPSLDVQGLVVLLLALVGAGFAFIRTQRPADARG